MVVFKNVRGGRWELFAKEHVVQGLLVPQHHGRRWDPLQWTHKAKAVC